jgi:hypothetical protein
MCFFRYQCELHIKLLQFLKICLNFFLTSVNFVTKFLKIGSEFTFYNLQIYRQGFLLQLIVICWAKIFYQDHMQMSFVNQSHGTIVRHIPPWIGLPGWAAIPLCGFSKAYSITKFWLPIHISNTFMNCQIALKLALQHQSRVNKRLPGPPRKMLLTSAWIGHINWLCPCDLLPTKYFADTCQ